MTWDYDGTIEDDPIPSYEEDPASILRSSSKEEFLYLYNKLFASLTSDGIWDTGLEGFAASYIRHHWTTMEMKMHLAGIVPRTLVEAFFWPKTPSPAILGALIKNEFFEATDTELKYLKTRYPVFKRILEYEVPPQDLFDAIMESEGERREEYILLVTENDERYDSLVKFMNIEGTPKNWLAHVFG